MNNFDLIKNNTNRQQRWLLSINLKQFKYPIKSVTIQNRYGKKPSFQSKKIKKRTEDLYSLNFGIADAAHVAFAEISADYFITCDDKLLKKIHKLKGINMEAVNPVNFCIKENLR